MSADWLLSSFDRLANAPESVVSLRRFVLRLAVQGKLIPQDPNDEPAATTLKRIAKTKKRLMETHQLKRDKKLWEGLPSQPPFRVPANWKWTRLQDVFEISRGGSPRPAGDPRYFGGNIPWITVREITKGNSKFLTHSDAGLTAEGSQKSRFVDPGDLMLTNSGATLGVPKISRIRGCINDGVAILRLFHDQNINDFAYDFLRSQTTAFRGLNQGMGQPNLNTQIIAAWHFPMPPLAEQKRIVSKVAELMALCDQLETAQTKRGHGGTVW